jgi:hypothetical protein
MEAAILALIGVLGTVFGLMLKNMFKQISDMRKDIVDLRKKQCVEPGGELHACVNTKKGRKAFGVLQGAGT